MNFLSVSHPSPKKASKSSKLGMDGSGHPKEDPQPTEVRQLVLDYLSHHLYLSTARALSRPRTPPPTDLAPTPETANVNVRRSNPTTVPADPNGELIDDGEDALMVEGVLNTPDELTEEAVRPLDPDGDAEMTDQPPIISPPVALGPPSSTVPEANGSSDKVEGRLGEQELAQIEYRKDIYAQILLGNIPAAISLIKLHYPTFLSTPESDPSASTATNGHNGSSAVKTSPSSISNDSSLSWSSSFKPSPSVVPAPSILPSPSPSHAKPPSSLHPYHVHLNILIQGFIETIRTIPLPPTNAPSSSSHSKDTTTSTTSNGSSPTHPTSTSMSMSFHSATNGLSTANSSPSSSTQSLSSTISTKTTSALTQAQQIYALVNKLSNEQDRDWYRNAVVQVSGLLAYVPPESAPTTAFLSRSKRETLANTVNQALLVHTGHPFQPRIETLVRQTTVVWKELANRGLDTVPPWGKDDGAEWTRLGDYLADHRSFVLRDFLDA